MKHIGLKQDLRPRARALLLIVGVAVVGYAAVFRVSQWIPWALAGLVLIALAALWRKAGPLPAVRETLRNGAISVVLVAVTLLVFEFCARPILSKKISWGVPVIKPHGELMYTLRAGTAGDLYFDLDDGSRGAYPVRISTQGLRDDEYGPARPDEYRIMLLGDSFTFGHGLTIEETISRQLQGILNERLPGKEISVINAGVVGYGPWQEHGLLREVGFGLEPDLVILQLLPSNDIHDTMLRDMKVPRSYPRLSSVRNMILLFADRDWKMRLDLWLQDHSVVYKFLYVRSQSDISVTRLLNATRLFHNPEFPQFPASLDRAWHIETDLREWYPELEAGWASFEEDILSLVEDCRERRIEVMAFVVPSGPLLLDGHWEHAVNMGEGAASYERGKALRMTQSFLQSNGITYIPLDDLTKDHANPIDLYYLRDGHFKPLGARIVSQRIAERVLRDYVTTP